MLLELNGWAWQFGVLVGPILLGQLVEIAQGAQIASSGFSLGRGFASLFGGGPSKPPGRGKTSFTFPWGGVLFATHDGNYPQLALIGYEPYQPVAIGQSRPVIDGWAGAWVQDPGSGKWVF